MKNSQQGFTMVEAMITIVILSIVVSLAVPSYYQYVVRTNRAEAIDGLLAASSCQERIFIRTNAYNGDQCEGATENGHYAITVTLPDGNNQNFVATATPQGMQTDDSCGALTLSDTGVKVAAGETGGFAQTCWAGRHAIGGS